MGQANGKEKGDSGSQTVDGGALEPQGVYSGAQDYNHSVVKALIHGRKLAPFYPGLDDEEAYSKAPYNTECPICFLYYPSPLNHTRCCGQPICTECFVQIKRADPTQHNPPSSEPATCPFCQETDFGVIYKPPPPGVMNGEYKSVAGVAESASAAREQAEGSAEGSQRNKRKSFTADDPNVVTIDQIRPDWQAKLMAAEAATLRRANRRIIMRQVGDRLIPVGVSSSRLGAELPPGSTTGPGGAIIIGENTRWGGERRGSRSRRADLTNFLNSLGNGPDMEEMMMMEAMRLSLLEHEEQQRRQAQSQPQSQPQAQAQSQSQAQSQTASAQANQQSQLQSNPTSLTVASASALTESHSDVPASTQSPVQSSTIRSAPPDGVGASLQHQQQAPLPRSSSLATEPLAPSQYTLTPQQLGISSSMMAELAELVDGGLIVDEPASSPPAQHSPTTPSSPIQSRASPVPISPPSAIQTSASSRRLQGISEIGQSPSSTPPVNSPSRIGTNPNNPFRRMSANNSPSHSRQGSVSNLGGAWNQGSGTNGS